MEKNEKLTRVEDLDGESLVTVLEKWELGEFVDFVTEKKIDGLKLLEVTEGLVKLWRPKSNAKKFINFIEDLKSNPYKYIDALNHEYVEPQDPVKDNNVEATYQTVKRRQDHFAASTLSGVEEIIKKLVPAKSFLYRNQQTRTEKAVTSYVPMNASQKKPKRFFRLSSYEYPNFDIKHQRLSTENYNDRGYYSIKSNSKCYMHKTFRKPDSRTKYKSLTTPEDTSDKLPEDHFYEDLNYTDVDDDKPEIQGPVNSRIAKLHELFNSFKLPFFKRQEDVSVVEESKKEFILPVKVEKEAHIYENSDSVIDMSMYDSVRVNNHLVDPKDKPNIPVEEYLEPMQLSKDYCDVNETPAPAKQKDESLLGYILSLFENRFGMRRETNTTTQEEPDVNEVAEEKWPEVCKTNMADRPLPVPVENEPYYMNIERSEAENLLRGQPDGTFILRPSSQSNHAYTLTVSCSNEVHNVGVRRRPDGRLALGFARRGERSFASVTSLLRHHKRRRLLLVANGSVCGATTLNEPPQYYQTPSNLPLRHY